MVPEVQAVAAEHLVAPKVRVPAKMDDRTGLGTSTTNNNRQVDRET